MKALVFTNGKGVSLEDIELNEDSFKKIIGVNELQYCERTVGRKKFILVTKREFSNEYITAVTKDIKVAVIGTFIVCKKNNDTLEGLSSEDCELLATRQRLTGTKKFGTQKFPALIIDETQEKHIAMLFAGK